MTLAAESPEQIPREDRLEAVYVASLQAYGLDPYVKHPIDKTALSKGKQPMPPGAEVEPFNN